MSNTKNNDLVNEFRGTVYANCNAQKGSEILTIQDWIKVIKSDRFKDCVTQYRTLLTEGKTEEARRLKTGLPAFICTACCMNGRKEGQEDSRSCVVMADYDNHDAAWSNTQRDTLKAIRWIIGAHRTVSNGLRVFLYLPVLPKEQFKGGLEFVLSLLDSLVNYPHDRQATNLLRLSFASYDPDAWYREPEECLKYPALAFPTPEQMASWPLKRPQKDSTAFNKQSERETVHEEDEFDQPNPAWRHFSDTQLDNLLNRFFAKHSLEPGQRNDSFLKLGAYARFWGASPADLEKLEEIVYRLYGDEEYTPKRIAQCMNWGYEHDKEGDFLHQNVLQKSKTPSEGPARFKSGKSEKSEKSDSDFLPDEENDETGKNEEDVNTQLHNDKIINQYCPGFPDEVYELIPDFIKEILSFAPNKRVKDMNLIAFLTVLSAAMPQVRVFVRSKWYSTHMFTVIIAPAGTGKGVAMEPLKLLSKIDENYREMQRSKHIEYKRMQHRWETEVRQAVKEGRDPDYSLEPLEGPQRFSYISSANTSRSQLIIDLQNAPEGIIIATSELDRLTNSMNSDYGKNEGELLAASMNETVDSNYKSDDSLIRADQAKIALLATGTPDQLPRFVGCKAEGMPSRMFTFLVSGNYHIDSWGDVDEEAIIDQKYSLYDKATDKITEIFNYLQKFPTEVLIPESGRRRIDKFLKYYEERINDENLQDLFSIILRMPIHVARICGVLCGLRKAEMGSVARRVYATEEDVTLALELMSVLVLHSCMSTTLLPGHQQVSAQKMTAVFTHERIYNQLPELFTTQDVENLSNECGGPKRSARHTMITQWTERGLILRVQRGKYKKMRTDYDR